MTPPPQRRRHDAVASAPPCRDSLSAPQRRSAALGAALMAGDGAPVEDAVRYRLFAVGPGGEELLRGCARDIAERLAPLLAAYIWQRQPFRLRYVPTRGEPGGDAA